MTFSPAVSAQDTPTWCLCENDSIYMEDNTLPCCRQEQLPFPVSEPISIGRTGAAPLLLAAPLGNHPPLTGFRTLLAAGNPQCTIAARALAFSHMLQERQYCCRCGERCGYSTQEQAMVCPSCRTVHYPRLSPCVIVAIHRDDTLLLAEHCQYARALTTVLAGYVEPGETLEQCVQREIMEEVAISVKNIRYLGSQSWPYPSQLMTAFTCDYAGGEIKEDDSEIVSAAWYHRDKMPETLPMVGTIARRLIDHFITGEF